MSHTTDVFMMILWRATRLPGLLALALLAGVAAVVAGDAAPPKTYQVRGVVQRLDVPGKSITVRHEAVEGYMPAMTMPFRVRDGKELQGLGAGDAIAFRLMVGAEESWIEGIAKLAGASGTSPPTVAAVATNTAPRALKLSDIPDFALTNELGHATRLRDFEGKAVALTFFFTRCPIPEYCPQLSKSFAKACELMKALTNAPANWQLVSISFDPTDNPEVLRAYGLRYGYDSNHWSFLTGKPADVQALTRGFGLSVQPDGPLFAHGFRTVIFNAAGQLQTMWPFGGDTSGMLVQELLKGAKVSPPKR